MAISAPARSTRCANRSSPRSARAKPPSEEAVLGILSLIIWALILVVTVKYVLDPVARRQQRRRRHAGADGVGAARVRRRSRIVVVLGMISAALFYGDAIITPALSVLSAVEGLKIATPAFEPYVVPLTVVILVALFAVQSRGTASVAAFFGPITLVWFMAHRRRRALAYRPKSRPCCGHSIRCYGISFSHQPRTDRLSDAWRGVPRRHRR